MHPRSLILGSIGLWTAAACLLGACTKPEAPAVAPGQPEAAAPAQPAAPRVDGVKVTAVRCEIAGLGKEYIRSAQADAQGNIYVFDDGNKPQKIGKGAGPCGLAAAGVLEPAPFAFAADGSVSPAQGEGECAARSFSTFGWSGVTSGGKAYVRVSSGESVAVEDLKATPCKPAPFAKDAPEGRVTDLAASDAHVLLLEFFGSGNDDNKVWRYRPDGSLVDKVGLKAGGGTYLGWPDHVATCADGVCVAASGSLLVFDGAGKLVATHALAALAPGLKGLAVQDLLEVGGRLFALVSFKTEAGEKAADLLRLDGVISGS